MILFYDATIKKAVELPNYQEATKAIRTYLIRNEPRLAYEFFKFFALHKNLFQLSDIQRLIEQERAVNGSAAVTIWSKYGEAWKAAFTDLIVNKVVPAWKDAIIKSSEFASSRFDGFKLSNKTFQEWAEQHGAELTKGLVERQYEAMRAVIETVSKWVEYDTPTLTWAVKNTLGLYKQQAIANLNFFKLTMKELRESHPRMSAAEIDMKAKSLAKTYAEKQLRYRTHTIARNELAEAYKEGEYLSVKQAQEQGLLGRCRYTWLTARNAEVCDTCNAMHGQTIKEGEMFTLPDGTRLKNTHAHVSCRCTRITTEIEPPILS